MTVYADLSNPDLLDRIPVDARNVLDVGCGAGALGRDYKWRNPAARYHGIEPDPEAARIAATRLDAVIAGNVESQPEPFGATRFDCIIFGDVLEHLLDPWTVLARMAERLTDDGVMLICMPNAAHWSFAERLMRGTFDYDEQGLFDRTHIRWFTPETTRRLIRQSGLVPLDVIPRVFGKPDADAFVAAMRPALERLGIDVRHYAERASALQHVWRATRHPVERMRVTSSMLNPVGGVSHVRVIEPMQALASLPGFEAAVRQTQDAAPAEDDAPRIFIFHRPLLAGKRGLASIRRVLDEGYLVLCEFDDHPAYIPVLQRPDIHNFRAVHAVQTSTAPLAEVLRQQNPEIGVFPNAVSRVRVPRNFTDPARLTLMFAGINREDEWPPYIEALNRVAALAGERLHFRIVADRGMFEALQTEHKSFTPLCDYDTYQSLLATSEICFMPLADTEFNRCKSDLKFLEAAAFRVVPLASPTVYEGVIEDGRTGLIFRDPQELQQKLARLLASPDQARAMADRARGVVTGRRMLGEQVRRRADWYRDLWARREELHAALLERVPELAQPADVLQSGG